MILEPETYSPPDLNALAEIRSVEGRVRIGVSACLVGLRVRWDGDHRLNEAICHITDGNVTLVPICPEVDLGMAIPRPPIRLLRKNGVIRLVAIEGDADYTKQMEDYASRTIAAMKSAGLSGFILKSGSPSCGRQGVAVMDEEGNQADTGPGAFAQRTKRAEKPRAITPIIKAT